MPFMQVIQNIIPNKLFLLILTNILINKIISLNGKIDPSIFYESINFLAAISRFFLSLNKYVPIRKFNLYLFSVIF